MSKLSNIPYPLNLIADLSTRWRPIELDALPKDYDFFLEYALRTSGEGKDRDIQILKMRYRDGMTYKAIADIHGISTERARQCIEKILSRIRRSPVLMDLITSGLENTIQEREQAQYEKGHKQGFELGMTKGNLHGKHGFNPFSDAANGIPLDEMGLSTRAYEVLYEAGMRTAMDVNLCTYADFFAMRHMNNRILLEVINKVMGAGYGTKAVYSMFCGATNTPVTKMGLSKYVQNRLIEASLFTSDKIAGLNRRLSYIPGISIKGWGDIVDKMHALNYDLSAILPDDREGFAALSSAMREAGFDVSWLASYRCQLESGASNLKSLGLSTRAINALKRSNIFTVQEVAACSYYDLAKIRNCGRNTINEIVTKMKALGYDTSAMEPPVIEVESGCENGKR